MKHTVITLAVIILAWVFLLPLLGISVVVAGVSAGLLLAIVVLWWVLNSITEVPLLLQPVLLFIGACAFIAVLAVFNIAGSQTCTKRGTPTCVNIGNGHPLITQNGHSVFK